MRNLIAALGLSAAATVAIAQPGPFTPAPVPGAGFDRGAPADRAGSNEDLVRSSPFSGAPGTLNSNTGQPTPIDVGDQNRNTAPSPNLSR